MWQRPDFEVDADELDRTLLAAFGQWEGLTRLFLAEDEMKQLDFVEEFCSHVRNRLRELAQHGTVSDALAGQMNAQHAVDGS